MATTSVSSIAKLPWGSQVLPEVAAARAESGQPPQLFQLYEFGNNLQSFYSYLCCNTLTAC